MQGCRLFFVSDAIGLNLVQHKRIGDYKAGKTKALENVSASGQTGQQ